MKAASIAGTQRPMTSLARRIATVAAASSLLVGLVGVPASANGKTGGPISCPYYLTVAVFSRTTQATGVSASVGGRVHRADYTGNWNWASHVTYIGRQHIDGWGVATSGHIDSAYTYATCVS